MNIKQLTLYALITISAFQTIHSLNIETLDLITVKPHEIAQAIKPNTVKILAAKALETGLANIPLANLKELLSHEQIAAKIVTRMNYINDITRENVHLFIKPIADNFDSVNQHTISWILYLNQNDLKSIIPIFIKNFKAVYENKKGRDIIDKIMELNPDSIELFIQPIIDNFLALVNDEEGNCIIQHMMWRSPEAAKLFTQLIINNFSLLCDNLYGTDLIAEIIECYPDTTELFMQLIIDNSASLINSDSGLEIIAEIIKLYPACAEQFKQSIMDNFSSLIHNKHNAKLILKILEHFPNIQEKYITAIKTEEDLLFSSEVSKLISPTESYDQYAKKDAQYQAYTKIIGLIQSQSTLPSIQCMNNNFTALVENGYYGQSILLQILKRYPETGQQLAKAAIGNIAIFSFISSLPTEHTGKQLLTELIEHDPQVQKALDNYHFKSKIKNGLIIAGGLAIVLPIVLSLEYAFLELYVKPRLNALYALAPK